MRSRVARAALLALVLAACDGETTEVNDTVQPTAVATTTTISVTDHQSERDQQPTTAASAVPTSATSTSSSTTTTLLSATTTLEPTADDRAWLTVDAFAGFEFGEAESSEVLEYVTAQLGPPTMVDRRCSSTAIDDRPRAVYERQSWDGLSLFYRDGVLVGWDAESGLGLSTPSGVTPGGTDVNGLFETYGRTGLHVVQRELADEVRSEGTFVYVLSTSKGPAYLDGVLSGDTVSAMAAGLTCRSGPEPMFFRPDAVATAFWDSYFEGRWLGQIATLEAIEWIEENGGWRELDRSVQSSLLIGETGEVCPLVGDVTFECHLVLSQDDPDSGETTFLPQSFLIYVQDIARPDPDPEAVWLGVYVVVGVRVSEDFTSEF